MELSEAIGIRRTIRDFPIEEVPVCVIKNALEAGLKTPSHNHLKQWAFVLVKDRNTRFALTQTEKMSEEVTDGLKQAFEAYEPLARDMCLDAIPKQKRMIMEAPAVKKVLGIPDDFEVAAIIPFGYKAADANKDGMLHELMLP